MRSDLRSAVKRRALWLRSRQLAAARVSRSRKSTAQRRAERVCMARASTSSARPAGASAREQRRSWSAHRTVLSSCPSGPVAQASYGETENERSLAFRFAEVSAPRASLSSSSSRPVVQATPLVGERGRSSLRLPSLHLLKASDVSQIFRAPHGAFVCK
jgi:hypothetical protein